MTFGDFARNYLNPFYVLWRLGLLCAGSAALAVSLFSDAPGLVKILFGALGLWLYWIAIKPWGDGRGKSIKDINDKLRSLNGD